MNGRKGASGSLDGVREIKEQSERCKGRGNPLRSDRWNEGGNSFLVCRTFDSLSIMT